MYSTRKLSRYILYSFLQKVVHTSPPVVVVAVPIMSRVGTIATVVAKRNMTSAARFLRFQLCKASTKNFKSYKTGVFLAVYGILNEGSHKETSEFFLSFYR